MSDPTMTEMLEAIALAMPQTRECGCWAVTGGRRRSVVGSAIATKRCDNCDGTGLVPVTAADLGEVDEFGRPSGWLWRLWVRRSGSLIAPGDFSGAPCADDWCAEAGTVWKTCPTTATEAITRALFATLEAK